MPICLDAEVSFRLIIQANSARDESNILISGVTDTFSAGKPSTEPEISHMLLYIDLHLLSLLCQQKYLNGVWSKNVGFVVLPEPSTACQSDFQPPRIWGQVSTAPCKPRATSCRMKRWSLANTVSAPVSTLSKRTLGWSDSKTIQAQPLTRRYSSQIMNWPKTKTLNGLRVSRIAIANDQPSVERPLGEGDIRTSS